MLEEFLGFLKKRRTGDREDRLSMLPDDLIHHIFSFINTKYAVQTSVLSTRWKNVWKSLPFLNLSVVYFDHFADFSRFVINVISYRDYDSEGYAVSHNVKSLLVNDYHEDIRRFRHSYFFDCPYLKQLTLYRVANTTLSSWNLPALESLFVENVSFNSWSLEAPDEGLFSEFMNLKNLTLVDCYLRSKSLNILKISSLSLETLRIKNTSRSLKTQACKVVILMPNLSSFQYEGYRPLCFSTNGFKCLEAVKIDLSGSKVKLSQDTRKVAALGFVDMLCQFKTVKDLTLFVSPFRFLAMVLDLLKHQPYPFPHLMHLKMEREGTRSNCAAYRNEMAAVYADVMGYFRESSPAAAVVEYSSGGNYVPDNAYVQAELMEWTVRTRN